LSMTGLIRDFISTNKAVSQSSHVGFFFSFDFYIFIPFFIVNDFFVYTQYVPGLTHIGF